MEDQATWKGHTFTLIVFSGIVMLCSIFFILGMLVGRTQGQKIASTALAAPASNKSDAKASKDDKPDFTFYDSVKKGDSAALMPAPAKPVPDPEPLRVEPRKAPPVVEVKPEAPRAASPAHQVSSPPPPPTNALNYQIGYFSKAANAEKLLEEVKKKGFRAFILTPSAGDANPIFRVQVGPYTSVTEGEAARKRLENLGYKVVPKK
jgi:cell division septation protein DedD